MTRIDGDWLASAPTQRVFALLEAAGFRAYAVGGCVRNALIGAPVRDIDIATDARPEAVMRLAKAARLRSVPTGIEHGTVTVVSDGTPCEVTTFRRDVETDGRRAVVAFSDRIEDDARRRDFTMNALYADSTGRVLDPLGGLADLRARRVRFIEDAGQRIREDYLRSLRYFRFHAWYGDPEGGLDPDALDAIARHVDGLAGLSRERIGAEMTRLLAAPDPAPAVAGMRAVGVLAAILPGADDGALAPLVAFEATAGLQPDPMRRLAILGAEDAAGRLRLSRREAGHLEDLARHAADAPSELGYRLGAEAGRDALMIRCAGLGTPPAPADLAAVAAGAGAVFPVRAADLMPGLSGPDLGAALDRMERRWIASGFSLGREALIRGDDSAGPMR